MSALRPSFAAQNYSRQSKPAAHVDAAWVEVAPGPIRPTGSLRVKPSTQKVLKPRQAQTAKVGKLQTSRVTPAYLHGQVIQASFNQHSKKLQLVLHGVVLALMLLACIQLVRTVATMSMRWIGSESKYPQAVALYQDAQRKQHHYIHQTNLYKTSEGIEALARNQLNYAAPGEVVIRLHQ